MVPRAQDASRAHQLTATSTGHPHPSDQQPVEYEQAKQLRRADHAGIVNADADCGQLGDEVRTGLLEITWRQFRAKLRILVKDAYPADRALSAGLRVHDLPATRRDLRESPRTAVGSPCRPPAGPFAIPPSYVIPIDRHGTLSGSPAVA